MTTTINIIKKNLNAFIEHTKPIVNFMIKTTNPSSISSTSSTISSTNIIQNYSYLQAQLFLFVIVFWVILFSFYRNKNKFFNLFKCLHYETIVNYALQLKTSRLLLGLLSKLVYKIQVFQIWKINSFIQRVKATILSITNFKGEFFQNITSSIYVVPKFLRSISSIAAAFSFNLKRVLLLPVRIKQAFQIVSYNISQFWRTLEQIIQIVRLPIEVLKLIGKFLSNCVSFLQRLETPRRPKLI